VKRKAAPLAVDQLKALGVGQVVAGRFGPEALESLGAASIEPLIVAGMNLRQAVELLSNPKKTICL
jgi:predicted Fe-Mo cluster-binding NifX family protein